MKYDFVAIGAGSAAFAASIKATEGGYSVALIEDQVIGGTCVNKGCVPSKALLKAGELAWEAGHQPFSGLATESGTSGFAGASCSKNRTHEHVAEGQIYRSCR